MTFRGYLNGDVREPARWRRPVPVLHLRRNVDDIPGVQFPGGFTGFLLVAATRRAKEYLPALVVYVPIVAAAGFKRDVGGHHAFSRQKREPALAAEILGVGVVSAAYGKNRIKIFGHFLFIRRPTSGRRSFCQSIRMMRYLSVPIPSSFM